MPRPLDLAPARWIWMPSQRTQPGTFALFRRVIDLDSLPKDAKGWIAADSRYRLFVNGERVQWGPAPHDPRQAEADPIDLTAYLRAGKNVIAVEVLHYGQGEGTWPFGKPGFLFRLEIDNFLVISDRNWRCIPDRARVPGRSRRSYLRALQEVFDARLHPLGWETIEFEDSGWMPAMELTTPPARSAMAGAYYDHIQEIWMTDSSRSRLWERSIPLLAERIVKAKPESAHRVKWRRDPEDWFDFRVPDSYKISPCTLSDTFSLDDGAAAVTYFFDREILGFPGLEIEAPEGTIVELISHESRDPQGDGWLEGHFYAWSRFVCLEGVNVFEQFDYEAAKYLQVHIRGRGQARLKRVWMRQREFPWPQQPEIQVPDPALQSVFDAGIQTLRNSCADICVDGMGRERQQYSGDGGHQLHGVRLAFGETRLPSRFLWTFGQGQMADGVFSDSWPAWDRLNRLWQKNMGCSDWGPILDHSVGFCFDHYHHWMQTGDLTMVRENWQALVRFVDYLYTLLKEDGMLDISEITPNTVWMDHQAYRNPAEKKLAFNLYACAAMRYAMTPMAKAIDYPEGRFLDLANSIHEAAIREHWSADRGVFENSAGRMDDRSLATAVLYDLCPDDRVAPSLDALAMRPKEMGASYPANMIWNYWALAKGGRIQSVLDDLRARWATMDSVRLNGTLQEDWTVRLGTVSLMSHCAYGPIGSLYQGILGIWPVLPGYAEYEIRPQLGDLSGLRLAAHLPIGTLHFEFSGGRCRVLAPAAGKGIALVGSRRIELAPGGVTEWTM